MTDPKTIQEEYEMLNAMSDRVLNELNTTAEATRKTELAMQFQALQGALTLQMVIAGEEGIKL